MANEQRIIHFDGSVQGVGFRFTACRVARHHNVSGYVRNLPDGRVECVVEGDGERIGAFVEDLSHTMSIYITNKDEQVLPYSGDFEGFTVKF